MEKPGYHFFVCASFRASGEPQGVCHKKGSLNLVQYMENEIADRGLNAVVSTTGCLKLCVKGPVAVLYPHGLWFSELDEEKADQIFEAIENGSDLESLAL